MIAIFEVSSSNILSTKKYKAIKEFGSNGDEVNNISIIDTDRIRFEKVKLAEFKNFVQLEEPGINFITPVAR